jgi:uncharacterized protein YjiS (DUF1127 family)
MFSTIGWTGGVMTRRRNKSREKEAMCVFYEFPLQQADASARIGRSIGGFIRRAARGVFLALQRSQHQRALRALSDHQLQDIGLTREEVMSGGSKAAWQPDLSTFGRSQPESSDDRRAA